MTHIFLDNDKCPKCGSEDIEADRFMEEANIAWRKVKCLDCNHSWNEVFNYVYCEEEEYEPTCRIRVVMGYHGQNGGGTDYWECTNCGYSNWAICADTLYCPHCGRRIENPDDIDPPIHTTSGREINPKEWEEILEKQERYARKE